MNKFIIITIIALLCLAPLYFKRNIENKEIIVVKKSNKVATRQMMYVVVFSAIAIVVGFFEIQLNFIGGKLDLSEVIVLISFFVMGIKSASLVIVLRSIIRFVMPAKTGMEADIIWKLLGEIIAIIASLLLIFSHILVKKILRIKEKPLMVAIPTNINQKRVIQLVVLPIVSAIILTLGMTVFHTIFTMPLYLSQYQHLTIFSLLRDSNFNSNSLSSIIKTIVTMFGALNLVKGIISPLIFLSIKPQIEKMIF